jgi:quinol monooxygenase YgiN
MNMTAVSTLEVRLGEKPDRALEQRMQEYIAELSRKPGCLRYEMTRSDAEPCMWLIRGYWDGASAMTQHFETESMNALLNLLIQSRAHLVFASAVQRAED